MLNRIFLVAICILMLLSLLCIDKAEMHQQQPNIDKRIKTLEILLQKHGHLSNKFLVKIKADTDVIFRIDMIQKFPLEMFKTDELRESAKEVGLDRWYIVNVNSGQSLIMAMADLMKSDQLEIVEPIFMANTDFMPPDPDFTEVFTDPLFKDQWALENTGQKDGLRGFDIRAVPFFEQMDKDPRVPTEVLINLVDTGIELTFPDLQGFINPEFGINTIDHDSIEDLVDVSRHGTHVAGIMGATRNNGVGISGVLGNLSGKVSLATAKFLSPIGGTYEDASEATVYGYTRGARVSNHSWTGDSFSELLFDTFRMGERLGHIAVCAAGNEGLSTDELHVYPAAFAYEDGHKLANVVAVASVDRHGHLSKFSNFGPGIQISAPGEEIVSCLALSNGKYASFSGTSLASPHMAGAMAGYISYNPDTYYTVVIEEVLGLSRGVTTLESIIPSANILDISHFLNKEKRKLPVVAKFKQIRKESNQDSILISWRIPHLVDKVCFGVNGYEVRISESQWDNDNPFKANLTQFFPVGRNDLRKQSWRVNGLKSLTQYNVGMRWRDACGNWSPYNIIQAKTK